MVGPRLEVCFGWTEATPGRSRLDLGRPQGPARRAWLALRLREAPEVIPGGRRPSSPGSQQ